MSQSPPSFVTCPVGHTFAYEQLTTRDGQAVCPVCDRMPWASPRVGRPWSRRLLTSPLIVLLAAIVMFVVETVGGVAIGTTYENEHVGGAGWLISGSAVSLLGLVVLGFGVARIIVALRSDSWSRAVISVPLLVAAGGLALLAVGDLFELGLNIAFVNAAEPAATWQLVAQIFDVLFFVGVASAVAQVGFLARHPDPAAS
jgi:hypothetical protein